MISKPKKIVFFGCFGQHNLGNDCTLQTIIYHARKRFPDAEFQCVCTGPEDAAARYNIASFQMEASSGKALHDNNESIFRWLRKVSFRISRELNHVVMVFKILKGSDMLIVPGTGLLEDFTTAYHGHPFYIFKWSLIAKLRQCKFLIVSMGAGPLNHPVSRWFIKRTLSMADYISYRDGVSKQYIDSIGFKTKGDVVSHDLVFSMPGFLLPESNNRDRQRRVIGVGLIDYHGQGSSLINRGEDVYNDYLNKVGSFISWLIENKFIVRVLIGDVICDSPVRQDLMELLEKRGLKYDDGQIINEPSDSVEQLLFQLANSDIVISPRFHNIVLALMLNKPVISLSYNVKFEALMEGLGLKEYCFPLDKLEVSRLIEQFIKLNNNADDLKPYIKMKTEEYKKALEEQYALIFNMV